MYVCWLGCRIHGRHLSIKGLRLEIYELLLSIWILSHTGFSLNSKKERLKGEEVQKDRIIYWRLIN